MSICSSIVFDPRQCKETLRELGILRLSARTEQPYWLKLLEEDNDFIVLGMYKQNEMYSSWVIIRGDDKVLAHQNTIYLFHSEVSTLLLNDKVCVVERHENDGKYLVHAQVNDLLVCFVQIDSASDAQTYCKLIASWGLSKRRNSSSMSITRESVIQSAIAWQSAKSPQKEILGYVSTKTDDISFQTPRSDQKLTSSDKAGSGSAKSNNTNNQSANKSQTAAKSTPTSLSTKSPIDKDSNKKASKSKGPRKEQPSPNTSQNNSESEWKSPLGRRIDTLYPSVWHQGKFHPITANTPCGVPFSNELFDGQVLLMVNTKKTDELYYKRFENTRYVFDVQVQGRFKMIPKGHLFFGAEITKKMELGLLTRGLCSSLLQLGRTVNPYLHHSFGDKDYVELPHITAPLWSTVDKLMETKAGETPPPLGSVFVEDNETRNIRRKDPGFHIDIDLNSIYSFSFKTSNIELIDWRLINIPLMKKMDLHTFWNDGDIRFVAYSVPFGTAANNIGKMNNEYRAKLHEQKTNNYFFSMEIRHKSNHPEVTALPVGLDYSPPLAIDTREESILALDAGLTNEDIDEYYLDQGDDRGSVASVESYDEDNSHIEQNLDRHIEVVNEVSTPTLTKISEDTTKIRLSKDQPAPQLSLEPSYLQEPLIVAAIEIDDRRLSRRNSRRIVYAIMIDPIKRQYETMTTAADRVRPSAPCALRTYKEWTAELPLKKVEPRPLCYQRLSEAEQRRQDLDLTYREFLKNFFECTPGLNDKFNYFVRSGNHTSSVLVPDSNSWISSKQLRAGLSDFLLESLVLVQVGNYHWSEQCIGLTRKEIIFIQSAKRFAKNERLHILLDTLIDVKSIESFEHSFAIGSDSCYLMLSTFSKQYLLLFRSHEKRDQWYQTLKQNVIDIKNYAREPIGWHPKHHLDLLIHPKTWNLGDKDILNARTFCRGSVSLLQHASRSFVSLVSKPVELVEKLLRRILAISTKATLSSSVLDDFTSSINDVLGIRDSISKIKIDDLPTGDSMPTAIEDGVLFDQSMPSDVAELWTEFFDGVSLLQSVDLEACNLSVDESMAMFINLYHCMLLHGFLIMGLPDSIYKWSSFYSACAYEAFGDVFSLVELEHCIIRYGMLRPNNIIAQNFIPSSRYTFSLNVRDYRLLWALNSGSESSPPSIPIYRVPTLREQLNATMTVCLESQLQIIDNSTVVLPQLCQWYLKEIELPVEGQSISVSLSLGSNKVILSNLAYYLRGNKQSTLMTMVDSKKSIRIQYNPFIFKCRLLEGMAEALHNK